MRGFRLAGVTGQVVTSAQQAAAAVAAAVAQPDCAILILTEKTEVGIRDQVDRIRQERDRPLIVEIPGPEGRSAGYKSLRHIVQEAVGIRVGQE